MIYPVIEKKSTLNFGTGTKKPMDKNKFDLLKKILFE